MEGDPKSWAQIPDQPKLKSGFVPRGRLYGSTTAPDLAHCDAVLRRLREAPGKADTLGLAMVMRFTGLRVGQGKAIRRQDIDLTKGTLTVRTGKSRREKADMRIVPLSRHLLVEPLFRALVDGAAAAERVLEVTSTKSIRAAWEDAEAAGEVPRHVWAPPNRERARPDHAFRAALLAHMTTDRVAGDVVSYLVGHSPNEDASARLREIHYGRSLMEEAREAVDALPAIDWTGPQLPAGVVSFEAHARAGR